MHPQSSQKLLRKVGLAGGALFALALGWLCWQALFAPGIQFLPPGVAAWIVYPSPPRAHTMPVQNLPAIFRRQFVLERQPSKATLDWRCFRAGRLSINGRTVALPSVANWKRTARVDVSSQLRAGTNEVTATVWADSGPPALSLWLQTDGTALVTDEHWDVSLAGAIERPAALAGAPVVPQPGNPFLGGEETGQALAKTAGWQCFFFAVSLAAVTLWRRSCGRIEGGGQRERYLGAAAGATLAVAWIVLLAHNISSSTWVFGFDSAAHLDYIKYIQTTGSLPLANQGLEMFQPPLYYAIGAALLKVMHQATSNLAGLRLLQVFNLLVGAADVALVWCGLGMLFPRQWKNQLAGAALAAYVPWLLYLLHYPINETLSCMLGTSALCLCLKCVGGVGQEGAQVACSPMVSTAKLPERTRSKRVSAKAERRAVASGPPPHGGYAGKTVTSPQTTGMSSAAIEKSGWPDVRLASLGVVLGAACLTKASSLALLPLVFAALAVQLIARRERGPMTWMRVMGLVFGLALAISAWHYWRAWRHFGTPFLGGWSRESIPTPWWQQPGYATTAYFTRFGHVLIAPYFCGLHGFWNALYSTFWGDGGRSGADRVWLGTPWNDDFMTAGYVWALAPAFLVLSGAGATVARLVKNPRLDWLLLTAVAAAYFLALLQINLKLPYLACGKASYALTAMLPFCAFAVAGWNWWTERFGSRAAIVLATLLGVWLINDYAAFWVPSDAPRTKLLAARQKFIDGRGDAGADFASLLRADPRDRRAAEFLARAQVRAGDTNGFTATFEGAQREDAVNGQLAVLAVEQLLRLHKTPEALQLVKDAALKSPDDQEVAETWLILAEASRNDAEITAAGERFLRLAPDDLSAHKKLAEALQRLGQPEDAALHRGIGHATSF